MASQKLHPTHVACGSSRISQLQQTTTNAGTQTAEVTNTESGLYKEIGKHLLDLTIPNHMTVTTPVGDAEYDITQRGTFVKDGKTVPSMYVKEM